MSLDLESYILGKKSGGGGEEPTGTIDITTNGITNVKSYASANVNVQPDLESKTVTITENTTTVIEPTTGKDGISSVSVITNIPSTGDDWSDIGYSSTPETVSDMHAVSKQVYDNWDSSSTSARQLFYGNETLKICPLIDTSNVTDAYYMFRYSKVQEIPRLVMTPDTIQEMFENCSSLSKLDVSGIDTKNCYNFYSLFASCSELTTLDLSNFNTAKVNNAQSMFYNCSRLTNITFGSNFKLDKVTNLASMFYNCSQLTTLDLSSFNNKFVGLAMMFYGCTNLTTINFGSNFDTSEAGNMGSMFTNCRNLNDNTLNQILQLCINATNYATKTLTHLGFTSTYYPLSRLEALSNWQDFLDAGWTAGY